MSRAQPWKLAAASLLAIALLAVAGLVQFVHRERAALARGVEAATRALLSAVDANAEAAVAALGAVAQSPNLDDLAAFREHVERLLDEQRTWRAIELYSPTGELLAAARRPAQGAGPLPGEGELVRRAAATLRAEIGEYAPGATPGEGTFAIAVPALREGHARYVVVARMTPQLVGAVLRMSGLPAEWDVAVLDRQARVIGRQPGAVSSPDAGTYTARRRSPYTGWSVVVIAPAASADGSGWQTALLFAGAGAVLALALALAWTLARRPAPVPPLPKTTAKDADLQVSRAGVRPAGVDRRRRSVLVAASDAELRRALLLGIASQEHRVYAAADGAEALVLAHEVRPDVALIDIRLPRVAGYEVMKQFRHLYGRSVWLVAIGRADPEERARSMAAGFDEYLANPLTRQALAGLLETAAGRSARKG